MDGDEKELEGIGRRNEREKKRTGVGGRKEVGEN